MPDKSRQQFFWFAGQSVNNFLEVRLRLIKNIKIKFNWIANCMYWSIYRWKLLISSVACPKRPVHRQVGSKRSAGLRLIPVLQLLSFTPFNLLSSNRSVPHRLTCLRDHVPQSSLDSHPNRSRLQSEKMSIFHENLVTTN